MSFKSISGIINYNGFYSQNKIYEVLNNMNTIITNKANKESSVFINKYMGVNSNNDVIFNKDKTLILTCDGTFFNSKIIKFHLQNKGYKFSTENVAEIALHGYEEYGINFFKMIDGKFSIAIHDIKEKKVKIIRDLVGQKPFFYYSSDTVFLYSSKLMNIIDSGMMQKEICKKALNQYLQLTYIPAPLTIFENIKKLLPGHYLTIDFKGNIEEIKYWDVDYNKEELIEDYDQAKKDLREKMFQAVESTLSTKKKTGAYLSGGIDSTIITGIASQLSDEPLDTFTVGYENREYDESERAKLSSEMHRTNSHILTLKYEDVLLEINDLIYNLDEPFADSSYIPSYMIAKHAKKFVDVVLTGDSGDEIFGGYSKYLIGYYSDIYNKIPKFGRRLVKNVAFSIPENKSIIRKVKKVIENSENNIFEQRKNLMTLGFKKYELNHLLKAKFQQKDTLEIISDYYYHQVNSENEISQALYTDLKIVLEGDMLTKIENAHKLALLESRTPMLSKEIIELGAQIPNKYKINNNNTKIILKDTFSDLIPKNLLRASKRGFGVPVGEWLRKELKQELLEVLSPEYINEQNIFNYSFIENILYEHFSKIKDRKSELWALFVFQKWYKENL